MTIARSVEYQVFRCGACRGRAPVFKQSRLVAGTVAEVWQAWIGNVDDGSPFATPQSMTITGGCRPIDCS